MKKLFVYCLLLILFVFMKCLQEENDFINDYVQIISGAKLIRGKNTKRDLMLKEEMQMNFRKGLL